MDADLIFASTHTWWLVARRALAAHPRAVLPGQVGFLGWGPEVFLSVEVEAWLRWGQVDCHSNLWVDFPRRVADFRVLSLADCREEFQVRPW
tara:strand:+ start:330 stop:605 length:276 start_codon:yes stop_codon:yes gene_type:complete